MASPFTADLEKKIDNLLNYWHTPGVSFAVTHGTKSFAKGYGLANVQSKTPVKAETLFYAASTTKAHLCAAWAIYIHSSLNRDRPKSEQVEWSTPLANIIREDFVLDDRNRTAEVTLEDALSHHTGIPSHELSYGYDDIKTPQNVTRNLRNLALSKGFRTTLDYCNTPFIAASHALERLTDRPLAEYLQDVLWKPLEMKQTFPGYQKAAKAIEHHGLILATGSVWSKDAGSKDESEGHLLEEEYQDFPEISGAGYVISNADDYVKWMRAWIEPGFGPLTSKLIKEVWTPRSLASTDDAENECIDGVLTYGLGWYICQYRGHSIYWHPGGLLGAGSYIMLCPEIQWGVTYFANGVGASFKIKGLAFELLDTALGTPEEKRTMRQRCQDRAVKVCQDEIEGREKTRKELCPEVPADRRVRLSLSLSAYTGMFSNAGYGTFKFEPVQDTADQKVLRVDLTSRTWGNTLSFEHTNAEHWIVEMQMGRGTSRIILRAESRIGLDGTVVAWGVAMEPSLPETLMWFDRDLE